ncbi:protein adenylyltransferase SelO [Paraliobacillus sediminis]|uniref:protein adenylyltransferase SelO n=1 Tax=Paraliobacillus sediminis TaxID=1885916 RepID=UPI000E3E532E|nr:YdiU family protein [Paraliobacillus sediminis]
MTKHIIEPGWNLENTYTTLPSVFLSRITSNPVRAPKLVILNESLAESLGLNSDALKAEDGVQVLAGNQTVEGGVPLAQAYAGHQFGNFTMLGDGRALLHGEQITPQGERFDIQLKGSGRTPYSRGGDGRATLGPMLREYIISEAMFALGIPTTRSLAVVTTGEQVRRETDLPGAIMTRVAASHLRVGTFEYALKWGADDDLQALADYTIQRHFPDIEKDEHRYLSLLKEVIKRQAALIAKWQLVGFIHGVMNTDNMAISGETIDYGPCAFMNVYNPKTVFSSIDRQGRYAYGNQPPIGGWNLARFAETLVPLLDENPEEAVKIAQDEMVRYEELYRSNWLQGMRAKIGIVKEEEEDEALIVDLLRMMEEHDADYTNTFRALTFDHYQEEVFFETPDFTKWKERWRARLDIQQESKDATLELMKNSNPAVVPRNHQVEEALEAAVKSGDYSVMEQLLAVLKKPYAHTSEQEEYTSLPAKSDRYYQTFCGT